MSISDNPWKATLKKEVKEKQACAVHLIVLIYFCACVCVCGWGEGPNYLILLSFLATLATFSFNCLFTNFYSKV